MRAGNDDMLTHEMVMDTVFIAGENGEVKVVCPKSLKGVTIDFQPLVLAAPLMYHALQVQCQAIQTLVGVFDKSSTPEMSDALLKWQTETISLMNIAIGGIDILKNKV